MTYDRFRAGRADPLRRRLVSAPDTGMCSEINRLLGLRCNLTADHDPRFHMQIDPNGTHAWGFTLGG